MPALTFTHDARKDKKLVMAKNFIIYQSRNRQTGTLMQTLDLRHADCPPVVAKQAQKEMPGARYAARCVEHGSIQLFEEHYPAGRAIAHPADAKRNAEDRENGWCPGCVAHMAAKKDKVTEATSEAYVKAFRAEQRAKAEKSEQRKSKRAAKAPKSETPVADESTVTEESTERELQPA